MNRPQLQVGSTSVVRNNDQWVTSEIVVCIGISTQDLTNSTKTTVIAQKTPSSFPFSLLVPPFGVHDPEKTNQSPTHATKARLGGTMTYPTSFALLLPTAEVVKLFRLGREG